MIYTTSAKLKIFERETWKLFLKSRNFGDVFVFKKRKICK